MAVLACIGLTLLLLLILLAWFHWVSEGGVFGFFMGWHLMETAGAVLEILLAVLASLFSSDT